MGEPWRFIDCGAVTPFENAAIMPVLLRSVSETGAPILTTSVWGQTHLNVGWFDDVDSTLDLEECARKEVAVIRRMAYGGGTAFYDAHCSVLWGFLLPKQEWSNLDAALERFVPTFEATLRRLDLGEVHFEGSSDLRWNGRKLGAMTAQDVMIATSVGGFMNTAPPDLDLYLSVARVPDEKFKDKIVKDLREYVCTAEEVRQRPLPYDEFRDALAASLEEDGFALRFDELTEGERKGVTKMSARVGTDEAIRRISSARFRADAPAGSRVGFGNHKGAKLCRAGVAIDAGGTIVDAMLAGDMHVSPPDTLDRAAATLVGATADDDADVRARLASVFEGDDVVQAEVAMGVTTEDLLAAVKRAIADSS